MRSFDRIARSYRFAERALLGNALELARFAHLPRLSRARRVLCLGEGDGRFLQRLLACNTDCRVVVVDKSIRMLGLARARAGRGASRVEFVHADALHFVPDGVYDGIVTLFFLDCFESDELKDLVRRLALHLSQDGVWVYADFCHPDRSSRRLRQRLWLGGLYAAFRAVTDIRARHLVLPDPLFAAAGFRESHTQMHRGGLVRSVTFERPRAGSAPPRAGNDLGSDQLGESALSQLQCLP